VQWGYNHKYQGWGQLAFVRKMANLPVGKILAGLGCGNAAAGK